jgi:hypothetical protein
MFMVTISGTIHTLTRHWLTVGFFLGFITDVILLNRVDDLFDNLILLTYVTLATGSLFLFYVGVADRVPGWIAWPLRKYMPLLMQYAFGGLLSGMLIFYGRSGDWVTSAPFLLLILTVILGNEFLEKRSDRLVYHLGLYFIGIFSYLVLVLPVLTGYMGGRMFILSGVLSLMAMLGVVHILHSIVPKFVSLNLRRIIATIGGIYIGFNTLYFASIIPPIPLSLTELTFVQQVERFPDNNTYRVVYEEQSWLSHMPFIHPEIHPTYGSVACFARVYAPTKLQTKIYHQWEYKDDAGKWRKSFRFGYQVAGTNKDGYRGYTKAEQFFDGLWRCSVETERGQVLGREVVRIKTTGEPRGLRTVLE